MAAGLLLYRYMNTKIKILQLFTRFCDLKIILLTNLKFRSVSNGTDILPSRTCLDSFVKINQSVWSLLLSHHRTVQSSMGPTQSSLHIQTTLFLLSIFLIRNRHIKTGCATHCFQCCEFLKKTLKRNFPQKRVG